MLVCQELKESWQVDRFCLEDSHLTNIFYTFIDDIEGVRRYWIAILSREEREAMKRIHADCFLHLDQLTEDATD